MGTIDNSATFDSDFTPFSAELQVGQFLGENKNYCLEKNLGAGGMGEVWLATEIRNSQEIRKVVVKTIRPDRRDNEGAQEKALKQFRLIQSLNHQNICPIYVIEQDPACGYLIVMGYANGGSYADWIEKQPKENAGIPLKTVCDILRPIADALDFAHRKGIIHRDVKPENMMFTSDGTSWLIDFGIASTLHTESQATMGQYSTSGTISYMAPEQRTAELQTAQTDEYSLGMVALEFLTGTTFLQAMMKLSPDVQTILYKALALKPTDRYTTCREFIDALAGVIIQRGGGSPSAAESATNTKTPKSAFEQILEAERQVAEAKRRAEEEALQQQIQLLETSIAEEYQSERYSEAITHINELRQLQPNNPNLQYLLKSCDEKLAIQKEEAERKAREEALQKKIDELNSWISVLFQSGLYFEAITRLNELLELNPNDSNARELLSQATQKLEFQKNEEERIAREQAIQIKINDLNGMINSEYQSGRYTEAINHLNELLQLKPNDSNTRELLIHVTQKLEIQKKEEAARKAQEEAARKARETAALQAREAAARKARKIMERFKDDANRKAGTREAIILGGIEYAFRWCPPGVFMMGTIKGEGMDFLLKLAGKENKYADEKFHKVVLTKGFWLLETQVTQAMWGSVMGESIESKARQGTSSVDLHGFGNNIPMYYISWNDCQIFCKKLSTILGQTVKLPTEAQWEYACRAGTTSEFAGNLDEMAWYNEDWQISIIHPVARKKPNAWGLYDMHGNVSEWCSDYYDEKYYDRSPTSNPENTTPSSFRVTRGGDFASEAERCRSAHRSSYGPNDRCWSLGLRVVLVPGQE